MSTPRHDDDPDRQVRDMVRAILGALASEGISLDGGGIRAIVGALVWRGQLSSPRLRSERGRTPRVVSHEILELLRRETSARGVVLTDAALTSVLGALEAFLIASPRPDA
jgi:hypothetical protein